MSLNVGILSIQGDVQENLLSTKAAFDELGIHGNITQVKTPDEISQLDGFSLVNGSLKVLKEKIENGMPVLGICAGMIMLSKTADDRVVGKIDQALLNILDIKLQRNSFGRQQDSFESDISMNSIGILKFNGIFIRAPSVSDVGSDVEILSKFNEQIIAVKKGNVIGIAFHPELTTDISLHKYFVNLVNSSKN